MNKKEFEKVMKKVDKYIEENFEYPFAGMILSFIYSEPEKEKGCREEWFEAGYNSGEHVIIRSGYIAGPLRALSFNTKTKEFEFIT